MARRTRQRRTEIYGLGLDERRADVIRRIQSFYRQGVDTRTDELEVRLQRYAKKRMWREGKDWPWQGASDQGIVDMMAHSLKVQDVLMNAILSARPVMSAKSLQKPAENAAQDTEGTIDKLLDFQVFVEQPGEATLGELVQDFVDDGQFTAFIPWIKERRQIHDLRVFPPIPEQVAPQDYFGATLTKVLAPTQAAPTGADGWDWKVTFKSPSGEVETDVMARFFTRDNGQVELLLTREVVIYDGPRIIPKNWAQVMHPPRAANLQMPGAHNPGGAPWVILVDTPTVDEIMRLRDSGFYDLLRDDDITAMKNTRKDTTRQDDVERQKDIMQGVYDNFAPIHGAEEQRELTRLTVFDIVDIDGSGKTEDVIWWYIVETKTLCKGALLGELFPANPPRRPLAEAPMIRVNGRRIGIGTLELNESLHDWKKTIIDQTVDGGTLANVPFFFYRASGNMKPESIRLWPGEGYALADPSKDVSFPRFANFNPAFGLNMSSLIDGQAEKVNSMGEMAFGQVPHGQSSALRTTSNMQTLQNMQEARPERILRNFFIGLREIYAQILELDQRFLPPDKLVRVLGNAEDKSTFLTIRGTDEIAGRYSFDFKANLFNTSKTMLQQSLQTLMGVLISPVMMQMGITSPDTAYRLVRDYAKAWGQDQESYVNPPTPQSNAPRILAEEVISLIMQDIPPHGVPLEPGGAMEQMQRLISFMNSDNFGAFTTVQVGMFKVWLRHLQALVQQEAQQQALQQAAGQFQQATGGQNQGGRPPTAPPQSTQPAPLSGPKDLHDESLPGAGGGANPTPGVNAQAA